jgi:hypothetical protein
MMTRPLKRNTSVRALGRSLPWETILPASFLAAAAACWHSPEFAPSIAFAILGLGAVFFESIAAHFSKPAALGLSLALTDSFQTFADEENSEQTDRLLEALASLIGRALQSSALTHTIKASIMDTLKDDDLQGATIHTLQSALIKASESEGFRDTAMDVTKRAFVGALSNKEFVSELMISIVNAIVSASQNEELTKSLLFVVTQAVSEALADEAFISQIKFAIKECLQDGDLYRASAQGMISAAFGRKGSNEATEGEKSPSKATINSSSQAIPKERGSLKL